VPDIIIIIIFHFLPACHNFYVIYLAEVTILMIYFALLLCSVLKLYLMPSFTPPKRY